MPRPRLDQALVERGLCPSREKAQRAILAGQVRVGERLARKASEPVFVRAADGRSDDEGWLLTVVDDANTGTSDLYVLDASSMERGRPEAIIHLPERLPLRSHGEWVPADRYR